MLNSELKEKIEKKKIIKLKERFNLSLVLNKV